MRYARNKRQIDHGRQPVLNNVGETPVRLGPLESRRRSLLRVLEDPPSYATPAKPGKLLDRVRWHLRVKRYSIRTEQAYVDWIRRYQ